MTLRLPRRALLLGGCAALLGGCRGPEGRLVPDVERPGLPGLERLGSAVPGFRTGQFRGRVSVLNVWASWCPNCRAEHDELMALSQDRSFTLAGLIWRDTPEAAAAYLKRDGNPYAAVASDPEGLFADMLGQRSVPASYVVDRGGKVTLRLSGELSEANIRDKLRPAVRKALEAPAVTG